jgi:lincosamide nucleotidyltransferase A/C/D/E
LTVSAQRALELLGALDAANVVAIVDGGWGVDALLRKQTREHDDLDLVVALGHAGRIRTALSPLGFTLHEDHLPVRFVLRSESGEQLDFHTVEFDAEGGGVQAQPSGKKFRYPPEGFVSGEIGGAPVRCISAPVQLACHVGYAPGAKDAGDVRLLCERFGLPIPRVYETVVSPSA